MSRDLPYNLTEEQLVPDASTLELLDQCSLKTLNDMLRELTKPDRIFPTAMAQTKKRVWDAALALYPVLLTMEAFAAYDREILFRISFDTAMIWEFG